jgi:Protein of unknown function (DUF1800)
MPRSINDSPWARYVPTPDDPWDLRKVAHLHRRAGFGATWTELLRDRGAGPDGSIDRLLHPPQPTTEETEAIDAMRRMASHDLLKVCWLHRILYWPDPLREKLTLFWHGHFATSIKKVESVAFMDRQWINSSTLLERNNWAADVVWGRPENGLTPFDPIAWVAHCKLSADRAALAFLDLLLQGELGDEARRLALDADREGSPDGLRMALQRLTTCPEFQLA